MSERAATELSIGTCMNAMTLGQYHAKIEYDENLGAFRGEILGLKGGAFFYGKSTEKLRAEFEKSLQGFLDVCREEGAEPQRRFSGRLALSIPPQLHERLAIVAQARGKSIDALAQEVLQEALRERVAT